MRNYSSGNKAGRADSKELRDGDRGKNKERWGSGVGVFGGAERKEMNGIVNVRGEAEAGSENDEGRPAFDDIY